MRGGGKHLFNLESVKELYKSNGAEFLDDFYINQAYKHKYRCSCGREAVGTVATFRKGSRCARCGEEKRTKHKLKGFKWLSDLYEGEGCTLLETEYKGVYHKYKYICSCGNAGETDPTSFRSGARCRECYLNKISGENNYNWNPNKSKEERIQERKTAEYSRWRRGVFESDDYTCQDCGERGGKLNAHHIVPFSVDESLSLEPSNGVTLCEECHKQIHSAEGIPLKSMEERTYAAYMQRDTVSPELEIDYDYETGDVCYNTIFS